MNYLLDTNILIYLMKNNPPEIAQRLNALAPGVRVAMSFVSYAQLLKGAERSTRREQVLKQIKQITRIIPVLFALDESICQHYARHFSHLKERGTPIGGNDLWIACHALAQDATLVTNNVREFERIEGLRIENWVAPVG
jgi:tRNA(fMet)-specific endonuclease VapC